MDVTESLKKIQGALHVAHSETRSLVALLSQRDQGAWHAEHQRYMEEEGLDSVTGMPLAPPDDQDSDG